MARLLVVEDDQQIGQELDRALRANGHEVTWQRTGASASTAAATQQFDLALLDLGLPDIDGIEVCRELRLRQPDCVIVMLTARGREMDVVAGLESGADDYLTKPFGLTVLQARIRAHLRRGTASLNTTRPAFVSGDLRLEFDSRRCFVAGEEIHLRPKEFELLVRLASEPGTAIGRDDLMAQVWDENWYGSTKTLDVHIAGLRHRLTEAAQQTDPPARIPKITTLRGHGYRLDTQT